MDVDVNRHQPEEHLSFIKLVLISSWTIGIIFGFNAEFAFGTPLFIELGLSHFWTSVAWLAGPIAGLVVQPIAGVYSDRSTSKWGRRKPYIFFGCIISVIGMFIFANTHQIGAKMSQIFEHTDEKANTYSIVVCITSLWIFNIGLNAVQGPAWALVLDLCSAEQQKQGNAVVCFLSSLAGVCCNLLGFVDLTSIFPFFSSNGQAIFYIGCSFVVITMIPTLIVAKEVNPNLINNYAQNINEEDVVPIQQEGVLRQTINALKNMSRPVFILLIVFFFSNGAFSPFQFYFTDYVGENVFHGKPDSPIKHERDLYNEGVRYGALGLAICLTVSTVTSLILPYSQKWFGVKPNYFFGHLTATVAFTIPMITYFVTSIGRTPSIVLALSAAGLAGIINSVINVIPYAIVGMSISKEESGLYIGILNTAQVVSQLVVNMIAGFFMTATKSVAAGMCVGAVLALIGCFLVWLLQVPKTKSELNEEEQSLLT